MVRSTNAVYSNRKRKRLFKQAKGFVGDRKITAAKHRTPSSKPWLITMSDVNNANGISEASGSTVSALAQISTAFLTASSSTV